MEKKKSKFKIFYNAIIQIQNLFRIIFIIFYHFLFFLPHSFILLRNFLRIYHVGK